MFKAIFGVVAVAFGALLVGQSLYVEHLFHTGAFTSAALPELVEVLIAWVVVLGGLTAYVVRRATPVHHHSHYVTHYHGRDGDDTDDGDDED